MTTRDDEANEAKYEAIKLSGGHASDRDEDSDRHNQDRYDVIQALEEFESMLDPRTKILLERIKWLEKEVERLKEYIVQAGYDPD